MNRLRLLLFLLPALLCGAPATPATPAGPAPSNGAGQVIEPNLTYRRVHTLPDDLPALPPGPATGTLVLDLRFVSASPEAATAFGEWLKARARPQAPVLVLINSGTAPGLLAPLTAPAVPPGVVSIGPAVTDAVPDVAINLAAGDDRTAYDALEHGMPIADLINPKIDKVRHDEAAMARERAAGAGADAEDDTPPVADEKPGPPPAVPPVAPVDRVLQRAVQLHHALLALKKV
jgi:hypothetical protein